MPTSNNERQCRAVTETGTQCSKNKMRGSKYCLLHQDSSWFSGILIGFLFSLAISIAIAFWQSKEPDLRVMCNTDEKGSPEQLVCTLINNGRAEATNIHVAFTNFIPADVDVSAEPEVGAQLIPVKTPPDPNISKEASKYLTAFTIHIPRVSDKDNVVFTVFTRNQDNLRTAIHILNIKTETYNIIDEFYNKLSKNHPDEIYNLNIKAIKSIWSKQANYFTPSKYSYSKGRFDVEYITDEETLMQAKHDDLYNKYRFQYSSLFFKKNYLLPVIRFISVDGERTYAKLFPGYFNFCTPSVTMTKEILDRIDGGESFEHNLIGAVPEDYSVGCDQKK